MFVNIKYNYNKLDKIAYCFVIAIIVSAYIEYVNGSSSNEDSQQHNKCECEHSDTVMRGYVDSFERKESIDNIQNNEKLKLLSNKTEKEEKKKFKKKGKKDKKSKKKKKKAKKTNNKQKKKSKKSSKSKNDNKIEDKKEKVSKEDNSDKKEFESNTSNNWINVTATHYTSECSGCIGITANGTNVKNTIYTPEGYRVIAVDVNVIPLNSKVKVKYGNDTEFTAIAADTGGAITGNKIDVLVENKDKAYNLGVQQVKVKIID